MLKKQTTPDCGTTYAIITTRAIKRSDSLQFYEKTTFLKLSLSLSLFSFPRKGRISFRGLYRGSTYDRLRRPLPCHGSVALCRWSIPQTEATTFAFSSVFILHLWSYASGAKKSLFKINIELLKIQRGLTSRLKSQESLSGAAWRPRPP